VAVQVHVGGGAAPEFLEQRDLVDGIQLADFLAPLRIFNPESLECLVGQVGVVADVGEQAFTGNPGGVQPPSWKLRVAERPVGSEEVIELLAQRPGVSTT
jgi:hypothetical protein